MKDYSQFKMTDFANDDDFIRWVRSGNFDQGLNEFWEEYLLKNPHQQNEILDAKYLIMGFLTEPQFIPDDFQQRKSLNKALEVIHEEQANDEKTSKKFYWGIAASISILILAGSLLFNSTSVEENTFGDAKKKYNAEFKNFQSGNQSIILGDGTKVTLYPNSRILYNASFSDSLREIHLEGEAFFEVVKKPDQPFLVHTKELTTKVLGTSFTVRSFNSEDEIKVTVKTGRVSVFREVGDIKKPVDGVILTPNLQATYSKSNQSISKSLIADPVVVKPEELKTLHFSDTPIQEVFNMLEKAYGVEIIFDEQVMKACHLNAVFENESLTEKLDLVCEAINSTYEMLDSQIIIHSTGCNTY